MILGALMIVLMPRDIRAQYDVVFSHYFDMPTSFNPAAAGKEQKLNVNAAYAMQLVGYENNPKTAFIAADIPVNGLGGVNGFGIIFMNDQLGLFTHQRIEAQYAYHRKVGKGWMAVGLQAGLLNEKYSSKDLDLEESSDPAFASSDLDGNTLDVAVGLLLHFPRWYVGIAAQHLTYPTVSLGEYNEISLDGTYYLNAGYDIQLNNPMLKIATAGLVRTDLVNYRGDVSARLVYTHEERMMYAGLGYSPTNSVSVYIGGKFKGIVVGYSYEAYTNGIGIGNGSHELHIGFQTKLNLGKKGKNIHKSVRYL